MTTVAPASLVAPATRTPLPYGLFSVFSFRGNGDRWASGVRWETGTCDPVDGIGSWQCEPGTTLGLPKDLDPNLDDASSASEFTVYGHFQCSPVGWSLDEAQAAANAHLVSREEARVEQALWTGDLDNEPSFRGATVVKSGVTILRAIGLLEQHIAREYGSQGVIHMTREAAAVAAGHLNVNGGRLSTKLGTPVVAGAGYDGSSPAGAAAADGTTWLYVTPALFGYRSDIITSSNRPGDLFDRAQNDLYAIAERQYLIGFDPCGVGAVQATFPTP